MIEAFPPVESADSSGLLAVGGDLEPESLLLAYRSGIFPWPIEGLPLTWFCPPERGILEFDRLHIPRSLRAAKQHATYTFSFDRSFEEVITRCGASKRAGSGTWITEELRLAYVDFYRAGHAHSVEAWQGDRLVGGLYGVEVEGVFAGESMFYTEPNASKLALLHLIDHLRSRGATWMDIQMVTPHLERLGARTIKRAQFLKLLAHSQSQGLRFFP